jgi:hypothetical protein
MGALHSRTVENNIAAAKKTNTNTRGRILPDIMTHDASIWQPHRHPIPPFPHPI